MHVRENIVRNSLRELQGFGLFLVSLSTFHSSSAEDMVTQFTGVTAATEEQDAEENEILYLCTFEGCGKGFNDAGGLRKHAHTHGEKQFICHYEGCGKVSKNALFTCLCVHLYLCFYIYLLIMPVHHRHWVVFLMYCQHSRPKPICSTLRKV